MEYMQTMIQWLLGDDIQYECNEYEQPSLASSVTNESVSSSCCSFDDDGSPTKSCNNVDDTVRRTIQQSQPECDGSTVSLSDQQLPAAPTFKDTYELLSNSDSYLGDGISAQVYQCIHRPTSHPCAVKIIQKSQVDRHDRLRREVLLLKQVSHPNIIQMYDCYEDEDTFRIVTEICHGGELFYKIISKQQKGDEMRECRGRSADGGSRASTRKSAQDVSTSTPACFNERDAAHTIHSLLSAVSYLHANNIVHRDIKPENILFVDKDDDSSTIKLIDFGLSIRHDPETCPPLSNTVGTSYYMAPELLDGSYDKACDLWSVGVVAYIMLSGRPPFNGKSNKAIEIAKAILTGRYDMKSPLWEGISDDAKDFISCLLIMDPKERWTADMAMKHHWLESEFALFDDHDDEAEEGYSEAEMELMFA